MNAQQKYRNRSAAFKKEDKIGQQNKSFHSLSFSCFLGFFGIFSLFLRDKFVPLLFLQLCACAVPLAIAFLR